MVEVVEDDVVRGLLRDREGARGYVFMSVAQVMKLFNSGNSVPQGLEGAHPVILLHQ